MTAHQSDTTILRVDKGNYGLVEGTAAGAGAANAAAMAQIRAAVKARVVANPASAFSNAFKRGRTIVKFPPGTYNIDGAAGQNWVIPDDVGVGGAGQVQGLHVEGAGANQTQIVFRPQAAGQYLWTNPDRWGVTTHEGMEILCDNSLVPTGGGFIDQTAVSIGNDHTFNDITVQGFWDRFIHLHDSSNLNGVWKFDASRILGAYTTAFVESDATNTDQALHYKYDGCRISITAGDFHRMATGGDIVLYGGTPLILVGTGILFNLTGGPHIADSDRLTVIGQRVETRTATSKILYCEWDFGSITFENFTQLVTQANDPTTEYVTFDSASGKRGPATTFLNSTFLGKHGYVYRDGSYQYRKQVLYLQCNSFDWATAAEFINVRNGDGTANLGGYPEIRFMQCQGQQTNAQGKINAYDTTLGWDKTRNGRALVEVYTLTGNDALFPSANGVTGGLKLPLGSIIKSVTIYAPAGATTSHAAGWQFKVQTAETTPTVLATTDTISDPAAGFTKHVQLFTTTPWLCHDDATRTINLKSNSSVDQKADGYALIEVIR